jgi:hypothetical protein
LFPFFFTSAVFRFGSVDYHTTIIVGLLFALLFQLISLPKKKKEEIHSAVNRLVVLALALDKKTNRYVPSSSSPYIYMRQ